MKHTRVLLGFLMMAVTTMFLFCGDNVVQTPGSGKDDGKQPGGQPTGVAPVVTPVGDAVYLSNTRANITFSVNKAGNAFYVTRENTSTVEKTDVRAGIPLGKVNAGKDTTFTVSKSARTQSVWVVVESSGAISSPVLFNVGPPDYNNYLHVEVTGSASGRLTGRQVTKIGLLKSTAQAAAYLPVTKTNINDVLDAILKEKIEQKKTGVILQFGDGDTALDVGTNTATFTGNWGAIIIYGNITGKASGGVISVGGGAYAVINNAGLIRNTASGGIGVTVRSEGGLYIGNFSGIESNGLAVNVADGGRISIEVTNPLIKANKIGGAGVDKETITAPEITDVKRVARISERKAKIIFDVSKPINYVSYEISSGNERLGGGSGNPITAGNLVNYTLPLSWWTNGTNLKVRIELTDEDGNYFSSGLYDIPDEVTIPVVTINTKLSVRTGAEKGKLTVKSTKPGTVYYLISDNNWNDKTKEEVTDTDTENGGKKLGAITKANTEQDYTIEIPSTELYGIYANVVVIDDVLGDTSEVTEQWYENDETTGATPPNPLITGYYTGATTAAVTFTLSALTNGPTISNTYSVYYIKSATPLSPLPDAEALVKRSDAVALTLVDPEVNATLTQVVPLTGLSSTSDSYVYAVAVKAYWEGEPLYSSVVSYTVPGVTAGAPVVTARSMSDRTATTVDFHYTTTKAGKLFYLISGAAHGTSTVIDFLALPGVKEAALGAGGEITLELPTETGNTRPAYTLFYVTSNGLVDYSAATDAGFTTGVPIAEVIAPTNDFSVAANFSDKNSTANITISLGTLPSPGIAKLQAYYKSGASGLNPTFNIADVDADGWALLGDITEGTASFAGKPVAVGDVQVYVALYNIAGSVVNDAVISGYKTPEPTEFKYGRNSATALLINFKSSVAGNVYLKAGDGTANEFDISNWASDKNDWNLVSNATVTANGTYSSTTLNVLATDTKIGIVIEEDENNATFLNPISYPVLGYNGGSSISPTLVARYGVGSATITHGVNLGGDVTAKYHVVDGTASTISDPEDAALGSGTTITSGTDVVTFSGADAKNAKTIYVVVNYGKLNGPLGNDVKVLASVSVDAALEVTFDEGTYTEKSGSDDGKLELTFDDNTLSGVAYVKIGGTTATIDQVINDDVSGTITAGEVDVQDGSLDALTAASVIWVVVKEGNYYSEPIKLKLDTTDVTNVVIF